jgi:hypothetical protein
MSPAYSLLTSTAATAHAKSMPISTTDNVPRHGTGEIEMRFGCTGALGGSVTITR